jgi:hypothetical protein
VTRDLRVLLIVITAAILRNEACCAGYVTTSVNTNKAACFLVSNLQQFGSG